MAGHPERTRMFSHLLRTYYWPLIAAHTASTVRTCPHCARNHLRLIRRKQPIRLFRAKKPLESVAVHLLGPLSTTKSGNRFIVLMACRVNKLTKVVPLKLTTGLNVAKEFSSHWFFKYGALKEVLSDNGPQFESKLYQNTCRILSITNTFTSTYHPQMNGQIDRFNIPIATMLCCYLSDDPENWDEYAEQTNAWVQPQRPSRYWDSPVLHRPMSATPEIHSPLRRRRTPTDQKGQSKLL